MASPPHRLPHRLSHSHFNLQAYAFISAFISFHASSHHLISLISIHALIRSLEECESRLKQRPKRRRKHIPTSGITVLGKKLILSDLTAARLQTRSNPTPRTKNPQSLLRNIWEIFRESHEISKGPAKRRK